MNLPTSSPTPTTSRAGKSRFRHVALVGKYHAVGSRDALERMAHFLHGMGCEVSIERETAQNTGLTQYNSLSASGIGSSCDLALVMGGDGTMLGIGRKLARFGVPVVGINQGRLGFITDIPFADFETHLRPILRGEYSYPTLIEVPQGPAAKNTAPDVWLSYTHMRKAIAFKQLRSNCSARPARSQP
jgi:NAD+ kinase